MYTFLEKIYWNIFTLWHARHEGRLPFWSIDRIRELQSRRVKAIIAHAYATVPFYREAMDRERLRPRDFRTADDLEKLPLVTGNDLAEAPERFFSRRYAGDRTFTLDTSGTSGRSKYVRHDRSELFLMMAYGHRQREVLAYFLGRRLGYRELIVCPQSSASFELRDFYEAHSWVPPGMDFKRAALRPEGCIEDNLEIINSFKPDLIRGYGSYIGTLFKEAYLRGVTLHRPKAVLYGADLMPEYDRNLIENHFGVPVLSGYQSTECLRIAYQCERRQGFHVNVDHVAVRIVDGNGRTLAPGERGEIVVSNLVNRGTVLLNYKLGDIVTLDRNRCPCGRSLPTLGQIDGRAGELILLSGGDVVHALMLIEEILTVPGVVQVQVRQHDVLRFSLLVVCRVDVDWQEISAALEKVMTSFFGSAVLVGIERTDIIPPDSGGKVRRFISECLV
jgi:phenylacetate-CoA ligase